MAESKNYFEILNSINVNDKIEKKNNLSYLSWPYAWGELKKRHPDANYTIYENAEGWNYFTDGRTCWVKTGVTVNGIEHIEELPIMDYSNRSIHLDKVTSYDVNKAIQRSLTKAVARHGLGLYIYAGEDIPDAPESAQEAPKAQPKKTTPKPTAKPAQAKSEAQAQPSASDPRAELREYLTEKGLDGHKVAEHCHLGPKSTPQDYENVLTWLQALTPEERATFA